MDESRKQFEESWLRRGGESSDLIRYPENHHEIGSGNIGGQYVMDDVQSHWQTWQASRAAVEIELPSELSLKKFACSDCIGAVLEAVENHVLAAGLKVKGG
ncbi:hypothetical protein SMZ85_002969 [Cronobacter sakazakii]|nr:hypothetical protein [Cronobacter sakazakii]ELY6393965.1 hypothetical protein [Cronobacter sakazakii]